MKNYSETQSLLTKRANRLRNNQTKAEIKMQEILKELKVRFKSQKVVYKDGQLRIFDFYLIGRRIVIEVDGGYHDAVKDSYKDMYLLNVRKRWKILRFKNE